MLAYRHAFHAGNHADVLKHAIVVAVLRHMNLKDKGWRWVDTHAGAGAYDLSRGPALKHAEFAQGIGRLWDLHRPERPRLPALLADYLEAVVRAQPEGVRTPPHQTRAAPAQESPPESPQESTQGPTLYPGSPCLVHQQMRPQDQLRLHELHPTDHGLLAARFARDRNVQVSRAEGLGGLRAHWPPPTRRGVLLIDPSYELKSDYPAVLSAVREALTRFAEGVVMVWIPQIVDREAQALPQRLGRLAQTLARRGWLHARLTVARPNDRGFGLLGSSMLVINPPHTLPVQLTEAMPVLVQRLGQFEGAGHLLETHLV